MRIRLQELSQRAEELAMFDRPGTWLARQVSRVVKQGPAKDLLSGTWLGHPLHPLLTDVPIGAWTSSLVLDLFGGQHARRAAQMLVGVGLVGAVPTAAAGLSDFSDTFGVERRVGTVHATFNTVALGLYAASWLARRRGRYSAGARLGLGGALAVTGGGFLGGHLAYAKGLGVDRTAFDEEPTEWTPVVDVAQLAEGQPTLAEVGTVPLLLLRQDGRVHALANTCTHRGGPLHEGELESGTIICPWHRSAFRMEDGEVVRGPATARQPSYATRVVDGTVEVRLRERSA
jgi:nitrite reductase/ring-hydroxylating ferredoxin subunit/uncharacterized membrane protein